MSGIVQQMLANPSSFLPEGYQWSEYVPIPVGTGAVVEEGEKQNSPCCNAEIGGAMNETSVIALCRGCGHVVGEFDLVQKAVRVAEKRAEVAA